MAEDMKERIELKCRIDPSHRDPCVGGCDHLCQRLVREREERVRKRERYHG